MNINKKTIRYYSLESYLYMEPKVNFKIYALDIICSFLAINTFSKDFVIEEIITT